MSHYIQCPRCGEDALDVDTHHCDECGYGGPMSPQMSREELGAFCNLVMCSDPSPVSPEDLSAIKRVLDREAQRYGFTGWVDAYHKLG